MLFGMFLAFLLMASALGAVAYFAWLRLGAHLKDNEEGVEALSKHLLVPLIGRKEKE